MNRTYLPSADQAHINGRMYITMNRASKTSGLPRSQLQVLIREKKVGAVRLGSHMVMVSISDLQAYKTQRTSYETMGEQVTTWLKSHPAQAQLGSRRIQKLLQKDGIYTSRATVTKVRQRLGMSPKKDIGVRAAAWIVANPDKHSLSIDDMRDQMARDGIYVSRDYLKQLRWKHGIYIKKAANHVE